ncbi:MAG: Cobalt-zinc-cadmium resistance protein CzcB [Pseudomonas fluorescens]|nr:MAG: Cobalt-zinc-cadmium resistance protein CzcB [Pseudomonas fluorescens]
MNKKQGLALAVAVAIGLGTAAFWPAASVADKPAPTAVEAPEEEGKLVLSAQQVEAAGIQLEQAGPRSVSTVLSLPGEVRFDEDRTSHIVPRAAGVVESVRVDLGQKVKKGEVLAVIASQQISDQRSETGGQ